MSQMNYSNPASRLCLFLEEGLNHQSTTNSRQVLQLVLNTNDYVSILRGVAEMRALVDESVEASRFYYPTARVAQHWVTQVATAFDQLHLQGHWSSFRNHLDTHTMEYLHQLSQMLDARMPLSRLALTGVTDYRAELNGLLEEVLASEEPQELKEFLVRELTEIIAALDQYAITGDKGVLTAVQKAVGAVLTDVNIRQDAKDSGLAKKTFAAIGKGVQAFSTAKKVAETIEYFGNILD